MNGSAKFLAYNGFPAKNARSAPSPHIKFMIPFAWLLCSDGVISGIKAINSYYWEHKNCENIVDCHHKTN